MQPCFSASSVRHAVELTGVRSSAVANVQLWVHWHVRRIRLASFPRPLFSSIPQPPVPLFSRGGGVEEGGWER